MKILGVEFAPLFIPIHRRLETLGVLIYLTCWLFIGPNSAIFIIWAILYSPIFRLPCVAYLIWMYYDWDSPQTGKRMSATVKDWYLWKLVRNYFPVHLVKTADLSPDKSHLIVCCPHGLISIGSMVPLLSNACGSREKFPGVSFYASTIQALCQLPVAREIVMGVGGTKSSEKVMVKILSQKGNALLVAAGGTAEAHLANPGRHRTLIGRRKGFVRVAFKAGASLVPTYVFGENELYTQTEHEPGSRMKRFQEKFKKTFGSGLITPTGRGIFQYTFGLLPRRHPLHTVVGKPIDVPKIENPSQQQIDDMHKIFCQELKDLFNGEKSNYLKDCENVHLEFV